jgi:hypothetical protein
VLSAGADEHADDLDRLRVLMIRWLELTAASPALAKVINQEAATGGPRLDHMFDHYLAPVTAVVSGFLRELEDEGRVRHLSPATWHFLVMHGAGGLLSLRALADRFGDAPTTPEDVSRYAADVVDVLLSGISREA